MAGGPSGCHVTVSDRRPSASKRALRRVSQATPPFGARQATTIASMSSWLDREQKELAEYSISGLRAGEDTTSLRREDVARTLKTAEDGFPIFDR